ncbi:MAG TPA: alpha/beta hydrolase [Sphingomicrobium sp.]|nr:alpha/beta hydrolase [Sphingomicrobium sp.]
MRAFLVILLLALTAASAPGASTGEHRFKTSDGIELWYRVAGARDGIPVLFLHGGPGEGSQAMQAFGGPALEKRVRMIYLDQRGSGQSERPKDSKFYSLALLESDVDAVRRQLGVRKLVLLAHSAGTPIALDYAADHPDNVAGLILTGAVPDLPAAVDALCDRIHAVHPELYASAVAAAAPGRKCDAFGVLQGEAQQRFFDDNMFPDPQVRQRVDWIDHIPGVANTGALGGPLMEQGLMNYRFDRPQRITMPLLFIAGGKDFQTAIAPQRKLAAKVKDGHVLVYPNAGHFMFADEPEHFANDVAAFVARVSH